MPHMDMLKNLHVFDTNSLRLGNKLCSIVLSIYIYIYIYIHIYIYTYGTFSFAILSRSCPFHSPLDQQRHVQHGQAWPGQTWPSLARPGQARPGLAWPGLARPGLARPGQAKQMASGVPRAIYVYIIYIYKYICIYG